MSSIHDYDLFLFDFDGLLVNSEDLHFNAYKRMFKKRGCTLSWSFEEYLYVAHYSADGLRLKAYELFPKLKEEAPLWDTLYKEKTRELMQLIEEGKIELMPGAERLLLLLEKWQKKRVVVTHSKRELIEKIQSKLPVLKTIPHWITREDYREAKPQPDGYIEALNRFKVEGDRVIGFEDSPRGLTALMATPVDPVIVTRFPYPELAAFIEKGAKHLHSLLDFSNEL